MDIKTYDKTIKDLFISGHQFYIPRFQREYSWDEKNYGEFLSDIISNLKYENGSFVTSPYFLGTMLFIGNFTENQDREIVVVDGQQRMTTITILFSAMSDIFKKLGQESLSKGIFRYVMTTDDDENEVRILVSKTSYPYFSYFIQDRDKKEKVKSNSEEEECIEKTYKYFIENISERKIRQKLKEKNGRADVDSVSYIDILKAVRDQVLGCTFVAISTKDKDQANRIFEILNAKGKRLAYIDLIKNKIFETLSKTEPVDTAEDKWNKIKEECNNAGVGIGTYYRHFWISAYKKSSARQLYDDFLSTIKPTKESVCIEFLNRLLENVEYYRRIVKPCREDYNNRKEYFWLVQSLKVLSEDFNIAQVRVVLMPILWAKEKGIINHKRLKEIVSYIENFHFVYTALLSGKTNRLESIYSKFSIELRKCNNAHEAETVINNLLILPMERLYPTYEDFRKGFTALKFSKQNSVANIKCRYALRKINCYYMQTDIYDDNESVEHILAESTSEESRSIGNLILLEIDLNIEADNKDYSEKIGIYNKSRYNWIKKFVQSHKEWNVDMFEQRANSLAELYYKKILKRATE